MSCVNWLEMEQCIKGYIGVLGWWQRFNKPSAITI